MAARLTRLLVVLGLLLGAALPSAAAAVVRLPTSHDTVTSVVPARGAAPVYARSYFGARYYRANLGRFTTVDPVTTIEENLVDPQRWNRYAYARNNPLKYVDPDGRDVKFATQQLRQQAENLARVSPSFSAELQAAQADHSILVDVQSPGVRLLNNPEHAPGLDRVSVVDGVKVVEMWVDYWDNRTTAHEWGHVQDVRSNWPQFVRDTAPNSPEWRKSHDDRAHEDRAIKFQKKVFAEWEETKKREKEEKRKRDKQNHDQQ